MLTGGLTQLWCCSGPDTNVRFGSFFFCALILAEHQVQVAASVESVWGQTWHPEMDQTSVWFVKLQSDSQ